MKIFFIAFSLGLVVHIILGKFTDLIYIHRCANLLIMFTYMFVEYKRTDWS
jgi:hypothetical protein